MRVAGDRGGFGGRSPGGFGGRGGGGRGGYQDYGPPAGKIKSIV